MSSSPICGQIAVSHDGQIRYLPVRSEQQIVIPEDLKAGDPSEVTGQLSSGKKYTFYFLFGSPFHCLKIITQKRLCKVVVCLWCRCSTDADTDPLHWSHPWTTGAAAAAGDSVWRHHIYRRIDLPGVGSKGCSEVSERLVYASICLLSIKNSTESSGFGFGRILQIQSNAGVLHPLCKSEFRPGWSALSVKMICSTRL